MRKKIIEKIRNQLLEERKEILRQLQEVAQIRGHHGLNYEIKLPDYGTSDDENADEVATYVDRLSEGENLSKKLEEIDNVLEKIKKGTYGICETCQKAIDKKRLEAYPLATQCIECKNRS